MSDGVQLPPAATEPVSLVTILYNSEDGVSEFIDSLLAQDMRHWRLYVIDNASPDQSLAVTQARADSRFVFIRNQSNLGFAKAANQGIRAAMADDAEFVVLINNDTAFDPDFLRNFLALRAQTGAEVATPRIMYQDDHARSYYAGGIFRREWSFANVHLNYDPEGCHDPMAVACAPGCCLGISRAAFEKVGLLDESFFVYWEDTDFCLRLAEVQIPLMYFPSVVMFHQDQGSSKDGSGERHSKKFVELYWSGWILIMKKHFSRRYLVRNVLQRIRFEMTSRADYKGKLKYMLMAFAKGALSPLRPVPRL